MPARDNSCLDANNPLLIKYSRNFLSHQYIDQGFRPNCYAQILLSIRLIGLVKPLTFL